MRFDSGQRAFRIAAVAAAGLVAACGATTAQAATTHAPVPSSTVTGRWVSALTLSAVHVGPNSNTATVGRLRLQTEDGFSEVYAVYGSAAAADGTVWLHIGLPKRPNGTTGWVPASDLGIVHSVHTLLRLDKRAQRLTLTRNGKTVWSGPAGFGAPHTPTPSGRFWVREKFRAGGGIYGPYALGTSDYSTLSDWPRGGIIGIHGTDQPALIPGRPSHGCIRLRNRDVSALYPLVPIGTPLLIR